MSKLCKPRRLWRPAVATHPRTVSYNELIKRSAMGGCGATARRHSLLGLPCLL